MKSQQLKVMIYVAAITLLSLVSGVDSLCLLCELGAAGLQRPYYKIDEDGTDCADKAFEVAVNFSFDSQRCEDEIFLYREVCCGDEEPEEIDQAPTAAPIYEGPFGEYDHCELCYNENYPQTTSMVLNLLDFGVGSCAQFYAYGQGGWIPNHLCSTLQTFAFDPCGCEIVEDDENDPKLSPPQDSASTSPSSSVLHSDEKSSSPTVSPTTLYPSYSPTLYPSLEPSPGPTVEPSAEPTVGPTAKPTNQPSAGPSDKPTSSPTLSPSIAPSPPPSVMATENPTAAGGRRGWICNFIPGLCS